MPIVFVLFLIVSFSPGVSAESDILINRWIVNSQLRKNGDLYIEEDLTFKFNRDFNGVFRDVNSEKTDGIKGVQVFQMVNGKEIEYKEKDNAKNGDSRVFNIDRKSDNSLITIYSPSENEEKTFRIKYTVKNVAVKYNDTGELYYKFLGDENETPIEYFSVNIILPQDRTDRVKIFAHGPLNGTINFKGNDVVHLEVENVPDRTFIEGRILFPTEFILNSEKSVDKNNYNEILKEENQFQEAAREKNIRNEYIGNVFNYISLISGGIVLILISISLSKFKRENDLYEKVNPDFIPEKCSPAVASYLCNMSVTTNAVIATILDLARRGYLKIEDGGEYKKNLNNIIITKIKNEEADLLDHEKYFMNWIIDTIGEKGRVTTEEIEDYGKKKYKSFSQEYYQWQKLIKEESRKRGYFDGKGKPWGIMFIILFPVLLVISVMDFVFGEPYGFFPLIMSIFSLIYGIILLLRPSDLGKSQQRKWKEFIKYMKEKENTQEKNIFKYPPDTALIYALALGINRKTLNNYKVQFSDDYYYNNNGWIYWYFLMSSTKNNTFDRSINSAFSPVAPSSGNIGSGGGFSGGGGGGAGGGGAGGF